MGFRAIKDKNVAYKCEEWRCFLWNGASVDLEERAETLKDFEGCFVRADAILARLLSVEIPPKWSIIEWDEKGGGKGYMWFKLGTVVSVFLPVYPES